MRADRIWFKVYEILACTVGVLIAASGCQGDATPALDAASVRYQVRIVAAGIIEPVNVRLLSAGVDELLSLTGDGSFTFTTELADGESYSVEFVDAPAECGAANDAGTLQGTDAEVVVVCALIDELVLSGGVTVPDLQFSTTQLSYQAEVSLMQEYVTMTAVAVRPDVEIEIASVPATSGQPSDALSLALGANPIVVSARHPASGASVAYQVTVDRAGAIVQAAYGKASNTNMNDVFGRSVALSASGDTLAVGAVGEDSAATGVGGDQTDNSANGSGAVYIFQRSDAGWMQQAYIKASNTSAGDGFGLSVALSASGDTLAVGAEKESSAATGVGGDQADESVRFSGAVYVFQRSGTVWAQQAYVKASNTGLDDYFGWDVALSGSGDTLAVSALGEDSAATGVDGDQADDSANNSGAVYVFQRSGTAWTQQAYVKASNTDADDNFGAGVALSASGDTLAVSARFEDSAATGVDGGQADNSADDSGAAYVFQRSGTVWAQQVYVKASNTDVYDNFGWDVALSGSGDTLAVGALGETSAATGVGGDQTDNSANNSGAVYLFQRSSTVWTQQAYVKASNTNAGDQFGVRVALSASGDTLAVGARYEDSEATGVGGGQDNQLPGNQSGAAYVFQRSGTVWTQQAYVKASNTNADDNFGEAVALSASGDTLAVGASLEDSAATGVGGDHADNSTISGGAVYLFH